MSLHASLAIPYRLDTEAAFNRIISVWRNAAPELLPTRAASSEPVRHEFDPDDLANALPLWMNRVWLGRRTKPTLAVDVLTGPFLHSMLLISIEQSSLPIMDNLQKLVLDLASDVSPDYGMLHALTAPEADEARSQGRPDVQTINRLTLRSSISAGFTRQLQHGLPTLFWGNLFGPSYVEMFGRDRLLSARAAIVREEDWGIYLQVSPKPPSADSWPHFQAHRDELIAYLGGDAFWPKATRVPTRCAISNPSHCPNELEAKQNRGTTR